MSEESWREWITVVAAVVQALAVPVTAVLAFKSLGQWRTQRRDQLNAELAEELQIKLQTAMYAIARIRSPVGYGGEGGSRKQEPDEDAETKRRLDNAFVHLERFAAEAEVFAALQRLEVLANVRFKRAIAPELEALRAHVNKLQGHASSVFRRALRYREEREEDLTDRGSERAIKDEEAVWSTSSPGELDEYDKELSEIDKKLKTALQRYML